MVGNILDKLIGVFSPTSELSRMMAREAIQEARSSTYAAAKSSLTTGVWTTADTKINTLLANSMTVLRSRARQLTRDMPAMATAIDRLTDFTVGTELTLQAKVRNPSTNKLESTLNQKIEDAWKYWCDEADDAGKLHFAEIQQLCCRQESELGEYVLVKKRSRQPGRYLPFSLMVLEPDSLATYAPKTSMGREIHQGVEYDIKTGRVLAYHFDEPEQWKKTLRVPVDQVIMGYKTLRPGQLRGVTPLAPVILMAHSLRDFLEANLSRAQKASRWLAFVTSQNPEATMKAFGGAASSTYKDTNDNSKYTMEMGNSIVDFLKTGEDVTIANDSAPGDTFSPFVEYFTKTFAATVGVTYELVSGDYDAAKYTGARLARNDMLKGIDVRRARLVRQLCDNVRKEFMDWAVMTGKLDLPNYFTNPAMYLNATWMGDGVRSIDPLREGRATNDALDKQRMSPQEDIIERGRDPEQVLDEIEQWKIWLGERGLTPEDVSTGLNTNPANVGAAETGKSLKLIGAK